MSVRAVAEFIGKLNAMTPEQIRRLMWEEDIQGKARDSRNCPLSVLIKKKTGVEVKTQALGIAVLVPSEWRTPTPTTGSMFIVRTSDSVVEFICNTDSYRYPELLVSTDQFPIKGISPLQYWENLEMGVEMGVNDA